MGDYRVYVTFADGTEVERRVEVASVEELPGGWRVVWESGSLTTEELVRPGVKSRREREAPFGVDFQRAVDRELRSFDLRMRVGAAHRFSAAFVDYSSFLFMDWVRRRGRYQLAGLEGVETPFASHATAARVDSLVKEWRAWQRFGEGFEVERGPSRLRWVRTSESWFAEGVGLVGVRSAVRERSGGELGPPALSEVWLKEARIQGVPYP